MACGEHLDWGYVDQPPARRRGGVARPPHARHVSPRDEAPLGPRRRGARPADGPPGTRDGRRRFAMGLSAVASALAFVYVVMHYLFTMNAFEPLFWTGCAYVVVRIVKTGDQRLWLAFGAIAGLGLQTKYSMAVFAFALVVGVLLSPERRAFARPWIWLGGAFAFLVFLPNVIWNVQHDWPFFELMRNIRASGRDVVLGPVEYVLRQVLNMNPANLPVWLAGLGWLLFSARGRPFRPARLGVPGDARDVRDHEGQGLLPGPRLRHALRRGRRRHRGLHGRRPATVAAAGPRRAAGPDAALPAAQPADPARRPADRLPGAARPDAARHREGPRASGPAAPLRLAVRLGRDGGGRGRRLPRHAARGAGAGRDHRQQLRRVRRDRPARAEVRPADEGPRHAPELLALGAGRPFEGRLHRPRRPARAAEDVVRRRAGGRGAVAPVDRRLGERSRPRLPRSTDCRSPRSGRRSRTGTEARRGPARSPDRHPRVARRVPAKGRPTTGGCPGQAGAPISRNAAAAATIVSSISASPWASETKAASNCAGGR